jgi:transcriptional regulator with XRE-family HTH domain
MSIFAKRLKEARLKAGLSQEQLGVLIGIEEASASSRMNHYEKGRHEPDFSAIERMASVLKTSESFFFEKDDKIAQLIFKIHRMQTADRIRIIDLVVNTGA